MADEQPKADAGGSNQLAGLQSRVDELAGLFKQWAAARSAAKRTRIGVVIVILLVIAWYAWMLLSTLMQVKDESYQKELLEAASASAVMLMNRASPQVMAAVNRLRPVYAEEIQKQFQEHQTEINEHLMTEVEKLSHNLADKLQITMDAKLKDMSARQKTKMRAAFPQIKTDKDLDIVIENLDKAVNGAAVDVMASRLKKAQERLADVTNKVLQFLPEDRREGFAVRMDRLFDRFALDELGGRKFLQPGKEPGAKLFKGVK